MNVADVDGSYLHHKREHNMIASRKMVAPLDLPSSPIYGLEVVNKDSYKDKAKDLPCVTPGEIFLFTL